jgi:hypothetical protein
MANLKLCECGCGDPAPIAEATNPKLGYVKGQPMRFVRGHATRGRSLPARNGGLSPHGDGKRYQIWCRDGTKVFFYRAVMEAQLGRRLRSDEHVHHINGDPSDDRPENLEVLTPAEHRQRHLPTHCKWGHPFTSLNTYTNPSGHRSCRICKRERDAERRKRLRESKLRAEERSWAYL